MSKVLVTGAGGFIGRAVCARLLADGYDLRATTSRPGHAEALRRAIGGLHRRLAGVGMAESLAVPAPACRATDWIEACRAIAVVVHLGARVHMQHDFSAEAFRLHRLTNRDVPLALAEAAAVTGVRRLVFVSTIRVNGNATNGRPFRESDPPRPDIPYAIAKAEAEAGLREIEARTGLEVVIVRPPLVYGPGVKGNMSALLALVASGCPLPLAGVDNRRSLVGLDNLVDALLLCAAHPRAAGRTFIVSDGRDISTPELIRRLAAGMGKPARLFPFPSSWLKTGADWFGQGYRLDKLCGDLQVDATLIRTTLGWHPPCALDEGLYKTAVWYRKSKRGIRAVLP
jgi:nucleoside-diphosphate-sugar epimerase